MGNVIQNIIDDKQLIKNQLGNSASSFPATKFFGDYILTKAIITKIHSIDYSQTESLVLGNNNIGILGQNKLDDDGNIITSVFAIVLWNNVYNEYFMTTEYIDTTNSTGTIDTTNKIYTLEPGEILSSEIVAKIRSNINNVKMSIDGTNVEDLKIEVSNDNGQTWHEVQNNITYVFQQSTPDDELKYRVTNIGSNTITITSPLVVSINNS